MGAAKTVGVVGTVLGIALIWFGIAHAMPPAMLLAGAGFVLVVYGAALYLFGSITWDDTKPK